MPGKSPTNQSELPLRIKELLDKLHAATICLQEFETLMRKAANGSELSIRIEELVDQWRDGQLGLGEFENLVRKAVLDRARLEQDALFLDKCKQLGAVMPPYRDTYTENLFPPEGVPMEAYEIAVAKSAQFQEELSERKSKRKTCLICRGEGLVHVPPCYYDRGRPHDGKCYFDAPNCTCTNPKCTVCDGSGIRTTLNFESAPSVPVRVRYSVHQPHWSPIFWTGAVNQLRVFVLGNYWTGQIAPINEHQFEALFSLRDPEILKEFTAGTVWPLYGFLRVGALEVL